MNSVTTGFDHQQKAAVFSHGHTIGKVKPVHQNFGGLVLRIVNQ